jgi:hypothetical protein
MSLLFSTIHKQRHSCWHNQCLWLLFISSDGRANVINIARRYYSSFKMHDHPLNPNHGSIILPPPSHTATHWCCSRAHAPAPRFLVDCLPDCRQVHAARPLLLCACLDAVSPPISSTSSAPRWQQHIEFLPTLSLSIIYRLEKWFKYCPFVA